MTRSTGGLIASDGGNDISAGRKDEKPVLPERALSGIPEVRTRSAMLGDGKQADEGGAERTGTQTGESGDNGGGDNGGVSEQT